MYEVPSAAGGDAGLEGFSVEAGGRRVGRLAALNRTGDGLMLVVDAGDAYRAVAAQRVRRIETLRRTVMLTAEGEEELAASADVEVRVLRIESPSLVRHVPPQLGRLMTEGDAPAQKRGRPRVWVAGGVLTTVGGVALFVGVPLVVEGVGGSARWLWVIVPALAFLAGTALLWRSLDAGEGRRPSLGEKASDAITAVLGISPRTRRRG